MEHAPVSSSHFVLQKWYLDCVSDTGETVILYCAEVSWHGIRARFSSLLATHLGLVASRTSMTFRQPAQPSTDTILLEIPELGLSGHWSRSVPRMQGTIFESAKGSVHWDCVQPKAETRVDVAGVGLFEGLGYAECLTLTIPPWRLPMRELRWGRYLSQDDSLVWIDWQGKFSSRILLRNGNECNVEEITDDGIKLGQDVLTLDRAVVLRAGSLGDTILPDAPMLRKVFPTRIFRIEEQKWRSRGTLCSPSHTSSGWAIHEIVRWNG